MPMLGQSPGKTQAKPVGLKTFGGRTLNGAKPQEVSQKWIDWFLKFFIIVNIPTAPENTCRLHAQRRKAKEMNRK